MEDHWKTLRNFIAASRLALRMARIEQPEAQSLAALGYVLPSGAGKITARYDGEAFCDALEVLLSEHRQALLDLELAQARTTEVGS